MTATENEATGIVVATMIFPLAFLLLLFKTNVTVDGATSLLEWGDHFFSVPPGTHEVRVSFRYLFSKRMAEATRTVEVLPGRTAMVLYRSPFLVFMGGSMKVASS